MDLRIILKEELNKLIEGKFDSSHLPEDIGLFTPRPINRDTDLILYSLSENKVYGVLSYWEFDKFSSVTSVAAEKGFGPFLYEMAMMHTGGLAPARNGDITGGAWNVWTKFYKNPNIVKFDIPIFSEDYSFSLITQRAHYNLKLSEKKELYESMDIDAKIKLKIFNSVYSIDRNNEYPTLINNAKITFKENGANLREISDMANDFFDQKYYN